MPLPTDAEVLAALQAVRDAQGARVAAELAAQDAQQAVTDTENAYRDAYSAFLALVQPEP